ncbi:hypothetical protein Tco_0603156 [Tanacetum coccineum]
MEECHLLLTDQVDLANPEGHQIVPDVSKPFASHKVQPSQLKATNYPDFRLEELVPSLWIESERDYDISVAYGISPWSLKTLERYGYTYLKEIVLRRADYKEYKISKADFKNLHPNDFEDLYLLHLQGHLNHLSGADKLGIESYQTKLNLTQPDWDASDFMFKEDYTIVSKPRADDRRRSKNFMEVIEKRLKIRRIFRSLESLVGGRLRDVDYRLIPRTE